MKLKTVLALLFAFGCLLYAFGARGEIIPASRLVPWIPGTTVGVRGGIPIRTSLVQATNFGATTNAGTIVGSITAGTNWLRVISIGDFAVSNGVYIAGYGLSYITNISGTNVHLFAPSGATLSGATVKHDNIYPLAAAETACVANQVVKFPSGTFVFHTGIGLLPNITIRGEGSSTVFAMVGNGGITVGTTPLSYTQAKHFYVTNGVTKGTNKLTLTTNYFAPFGTVIQAGEMYLLSTLNGGDTNERVLSVYGYERVRQQLVYVENVTGNTVTFTPPTTWYFTNQPYFVQLFSTATIGVGLENFRVTLTNAGETATPFTTYDIVALNGTVDSWVQGVDAVYANNYNIHLYGSVHSQVESNYIGHALSGGTSHSGLIAEYVSGALIQNNIFEDLGFAMQGWAGSMVGSAIFANFFTNCAYTDFFYHNTHHSMNLFEANNFDIGFQSDGYYGSNGKTTFFRNRHPSSVSLKRFSSQMNFVGNVFGSSAYNFCYDHDHQHPGCQYAIFEMGFPNIGNTTYIGDSPPTAWNFPGGTFYGAHGEPALTPPYGREHNYSNIFLKLTTNVLSTKIVGGALCLEIGGDFSAWPYDANGSYTLRYQDATDTNKYYTLSQTVEPVKQAFTSQVGIPSATNLLIFPATNEAGIFVLSNGWTIWTSSADNYQQLQTIDRTSHVRHGNYVVTNSMGVLVWDAAIADHTLWSSFVYSNGAPSWWGTNRWPAIDPEASTKITTIPAQNRFNGIESESGTNPPDPPVGVEVGIVTQTVNDAYFAWHGGTNRLAPPAPNGNLRGSYFQWHLDNPEGPQVLVYENEVHQAQFDEPAGFGSCNVARGWSVQSYASNIIVAIIDDSFDLGHPELQGRWWINPATGVPGIRISSGVESTNVNVSDAQVHGMQAAGIIGAIGNNTAGVAGVCKDGVKIMPIACAGSNSDLGRGVLWAATNGAHIILFAYGWHLQETAWTNAFMVAQERGVLVVQAVLESSVHDIGGEFATFVARDYPCQWGRFTTTNIIPVLTNLLTVTCSRMDEIRYSIGGYSTNFVDLLYPGRRIPTCLPPGSYTAHGGTSPAAAIAAGQVALLKERYWNEEMWQIKERILATVHTNAVYGTNCLSRGQGDVYASMIWQPTNRPPVLRGYR